ncbi:MAG: DUF3047 domain-containing protein [Desulfuromonadaceae bacterium]
MRSANSIIFALLMLFLTSLPVYATEIAVSRFGSEGLNGWEVKSFKGTTDYRIVHEDGRSVVKARAIGTASGLTKKIKFNPATYHYLKWSWKVDGTVAGGDEMTKGGDDYAARVYVIFPGRFFWQTRALNYIWANRLPKGEFTPNAFTANAMMIAVESGAPESGQWRYEVRDILSDYRRAFGENPPEAGAVAIMTDSDNTGAAATAWYGDITLSTTR